MILRNLPSNFESTYKKPPFINVAIFFWGNFSVKLSWSQRRGNKLNTTLYDRWYLQNCKAITFRKIANNTKYKKPNVPSHFHIFWVNFDKENHSFLYPFLLLEETDFQKNSAWNPEWETEAWVKMLRFDAFSRNVNTINSKSFPTYGGIYKLNS